MTKMVLNLKALSYNRDRSLLDYRVPVNGRDVHERLCRSEARG